MAMGTRKQREKQEDIWIAHTELALAPGHPFYQRLNELLEAEGFDEFVEGRCAQFYAAKYGRPSLTPGIYFRSLLIGYFEGIDSERGIAWRLADSLALQGADQGDTTTLDETLSEAGMAVAEQIGREAELRPDQQPKVNVNGIEELVTDKGYHSGAVVERVKSYEVRSYIPEKQQKGLRNWQGKAEEQQAVYANRRRVRGEYGKSLLRRRGELVERSFAHCYETGGMRRCHLRGRDNILKRQLVHVGVFNLSLILRQLLGAGMPREWRNRFAKLVLFLYFLFTRRKDSNRLCRSQSRCPARNPSQDYETKHAAGRAENQLLTPRAARDKNGEPEGSPSYSNSNPVCLEEQLEGELDVAPLVRQRTILGARTWRAPHGLNGTRGVGLCTRLDIQVASKNVIVVVIKEVVELAAELHGEPLGQLEVLHGHKINVPVVRRDKPVARWDGLAVVAESTANAVQPRARRYCECVSDPNRTASGRVDRQVNVVEGVWTAGY